MERKKNNKLPYIAAAFTAVIFGFSFLFTKGALDYLSTFQLLGFRFLTAALFLSFLWIVGAIKLNIKKEDFKKLLIVALFQPVMYFICETIGVRLTTASEAGIIISLVPIAITICAVFILGEKINRVQWISIVVSVAGVVLIVIAKGSSSTGGYLIGTVALIGAVVAAGFYNPISRKTSTSSTPTEITFVMMWVGAIVFNLIGTISSNGIGAYFAPFMNKEVLVSIAYLGLLSSVGAFFLLNYSLSKVEASKTAAMMNLTPVIAVAAGIFIRNEEFYLLQFVGAGLIFLGIWGTNRNPKVYS